MNFSKPPIVEAVVDIECDFAPNYEPNNYADAGFEAFSADYPVKKIQFSEEFQFIAKDGAPLAHQSSRKIQAIQFRSSDQKQLIQFRLQGFAFNRLAPYDRLDAYYPEIQKSWNQFVAIASPIRVRAIHLRYINRILVPTENGKVELAEYFVNPPQLPAGADLVFGSFLYQYSAASQTAGTVANVVLTTQEPESKVLPVILDIGTTARKDGDVANWGWIRDNIEALRQLKNSIFRNTLTDKCRHLFQ